MGFPFRRILTAAAATVALMAAVPAAHAQSSTIVAVVNGDVISQGDVDNRTRLFALSSGIGASPDTQSRLKAQVLQQLIDERLRLQESQRRHVVISDKQIADAIHGVEQRNGMPTDALRTKLQSDGVSFRTLIDQVRVQLAWLQVIRQQLGESATITSKEVEEQQQLLTQEIGKPEYNVGEIFVPIDNPSHAADAERFAETIIAQLRSGANFAVTAAQFSQSQTALQGGALGWVQPDQLDPGVATLVAEMPVGAISDPVRVPGGISIIQLDAKRQIGNDVGTVVNIRTLFLPFSSPLNPAAPTEQQKALLERAKALSASIHSCAEMEAAAKANNSTRPVDPGDIKLESVNPPVFREMLSTLPEGKTTQPLVAQDGISLVTLCSRQQKNLATESREDIERRLLAERAELASRQLLRDLQRRANINIRQAQTAAKT
ncbi:MAG TPA: peptidylprolyl isomerase [Acidisphaera sp.]|nr:peptidylprolyl isomerase [Acidisphaera sp.]